jgi:hypothetical protein
LFFRAAAVLMVLGFGSTILHFTEIQFKVLIWAEPAQPALGLLIGVAGTVFLGLGIANSNKSKQQPYGQSPAGRPMPPAPPRGGQPHPQQYGSQPPYGQHQYGPPGDPGPHRR